MAGCRGVSTENAGRQPRFEQVDELKLIDAWLQRKYRSRQLEAYLADEKNLSSAFRRLRYAGFSATASLRVLKRYAQSAGDVDPGDLENPDSDT